MSDTTEQIRELAYYLWEARGRPHGADIEHWVEAQRILANGANGHSDSADEPSATKPGKATKHGKKAKLEKANDKRTRKKAKRLASGASYLLPVSSERMGGCSAAVKAEKGIGSATPEPDR